MAVNKRLANACDNIDRASGTVAGASMAGSFFLGFLNLAGLTFKNALGLKDWVAERREKKRSVLRDRFQKALGSLQAYEDIVEERYTDEGTRNYMELHNSRITERSSG